MFTGELDQLRIPRTSTVGTKKFELIALPFAMMFSTALRGLAVLVKPGSHDNVSSLAENPNHLSFGVKLMVVIFQWTVVGFQYYGCTMNFVATLCYIKAIIPLLQHLR